MAAALSKRGVDLKRFARVEDDRGRPWPFVTKDRPFAKDLLAELKRDAPDDGFRGYRVNAIEPGRRREGEGQILIRMGRNASGATFELHGLSAAGIRRLTGIDPLRDARVPADLGDLTEIERYDWALRRLTELDTKQLALLGGYVIRDVTTGDVVHAFAPRQVPAISSTGS